MKILITGVAGFIGFHLSKFLLKKNFEIVGIDNINNYYDPKLKIDRLKILINDKLHFKKLNFAEKSKVDSIFSDIRPSIVIHLGAQAGVRHSIKHPQDYIESNIIGFQNIIENCRKFNVNHFLYASSSSIYGLNKEIPFSECQTTDHPANLYGATKKSNELVAFSYSNLYSLPTTGLRFFTVYGPWGRPDMAYFKFTKNIIEQKPINVYGNGDMYRDFTYIDDVVHIISELVNTTPINNSNNIYKSVPAEIYNIGNNKAEHLEKFIEIIENSTKLKAIKKYLPIQMGDIIKTCANIDKIQKKLNFTPKVNITTGIPLFVDWFKSYYKEV
jgi:UDP-glucuronate 4-epimerase